MAKMWHDAESLPYATRLTPMKPERIAHQIWHAQPVAITVALSVGSVWMARRDVIVRRL
jgi:hypothetical protein